MSQLPSNQEESLFDQYDKEIFTGRKIELNGWPETRYKSGDMITFARRYAAEAIEWRPIEEFDQSERDVPIGWRHVDGDWWWKRGSFQNGRWWDLSMDIELFPTHFIPLPPPPQAIL